MRAGIARQKSELLQLRSQLGVEFHQRARHTQTARTCLPADTAAVSEDEDIEPVGRFGRKQRLPHVGASRLADKIIIDRPVVYFDFAFARPQKYSSRRGFAASGP